MPDGEIVALLGANGAGKTTTLRAISGLLDVHDGEITKGSVTFDGERIDGKKPAEIVERGIKQVMEGRRVFAELTVDENLICRRLHQPRPGGRRRGPRAGDGRCSRGSPSGASRSPATCPAASSRCSRSAGR